MRWAWSTWSWQCCFPLILRESKSSGSGRDREGKVPILSRKYCQFYSHGKQYKPEVAVNQSTTTCFIEHISKSQPIRANLTLWKSVNWWWTYSSEHTSKLMPICSSVCNQHKRHFWGWHFPTLAPSPKLCSKSSKLCSKSAQRGLSQWSLCSLKSRMTSMALPYLSR